MPAGSWDMATRQCLVGDRWATVREEFQLEYDFIVVDTAPLLLMADSLLLAKSVDGAVLSVLQGVSRIGAVSLTFERLRSMGVRVLGAVVSGASAEYGSEYYSRYNSTPVARRDREAPITLSIA